MPSLTEIEMLADLSLVRAKATAAIVAIGIALLFVSSALASISLPREKLGELSLDEEQKQLEALLAQSKGDPYVVEQLARIAYQRSNVTLARQLWDRAASEEPNIAGAAVQLAFADIASGRLESAQKRLNDLDVANTTDAHVVIAAADLAMVRNDLKTAHGLLMRALDLAPQYAATHLTLGHLYEVAGQDDSAQTQYEKVTELQPDRASGWLRLANLDFRKGRYQQALDAYRKAEKCRGIQPLAETRMGEAYYRSGDTYAAHQQFVAALKRKPDDPFPRLRLAQTLRQTGRKEQARAELDKIVKSTEYPEALRIIGDDELTAGNRSEAIKFYRRALKANDRDWISANNLAILLVQTKGSPDEALKLVEIAEKAAPQPLASILGTKACVLWFAGRNKEAEPLFEQAIAAVPNYPWTRYCYGQMLRATNRPAEAKEQFRACLFLDPKFERREELGDVGSAD